MLVGKMRRECEWTRTRGQVDTLTRGKVEIWTRRHVYIYTRGHMDTWKCVHVATWTCGHVHTLPRVHVYTWTFSLPCHSRGTLGFTYDWYTSGRRLTGNTRMRVSSRAAESVVHVSLV